MIKIGVAGCAGKMGKMIVDAVLKEKNVVLSGCFEKKDSTEIGKNVISASGIKTDLIIQDDIKKIINDIDIIIDFTTPEATLNNIKVVNEYKKKIVIGTTGLNEAQLNEIKNYSKNIAIVLSPNMSTGVNLLFKLVEEVSKIIGYDADIEIVEYHHNLKKDAPSGTALKLADNIAKTLDWQLNEVIKTGRDGIIGKRPKKEIGVFAIRAGDIVGEHTVIFAMEGERIELTHKAHSRMTFAVGAVKAAIWLNNKLSGFYNMNDVLGI
ncbi:MAG TPA: 4-hydroxy-tetrahydrodipicolinate reductase [bacterium]|nr:4-hydroxy-tetrahydrodipicolinate reductase [bacterium]HOL47175.1 4-hydroxy-tetrahydrodipicolinate reductase [bacterium]HPQ17668.1 4-hydroxy-tetrahydrodipicolinate reductase [bacterium]